MKDSYALLVICLLIFELWWIISQSKWIKTQYEKKEILLITKVLVFQACAAALAHIAWIFILS